MSEVRKMAKKLARTDPSEIDRLYGLDPVYEPGSDPRMVSLTTDAEVRCPYCGQCYDSSIDVSAGSQRMVEDCQICCRPIDLDIQIDPATGAVALQAYRLDS